MKFSSYGPQVAVSSSAPAKQSSPRYVAENGAGALAMGKAFTQVAAVAQKKQDESDALDVMAGRNEVMTQLVDKFYGDNGLMYRQGVNAEGLAKDARKTITDTFDDVTKRYNPRVQRTLRGNLNENIGNFLRVAAQQEKNEGIKIQDATYKNNIANSVNMIGLNYSDDKSVADSIQDAQRIIASYGSIRGLSDEQKQQENRAFLDKAAEAYVKNAMDNNDYDRANDFLNKNKTNMNIDTLNKLRKSVKQGTQKVETHSFIDEIWQQYGTDVTGAKQAIQEHYAGKKTGKLNVSDYADSNDDVDVGTFTGNMSQKVAQVAKEYYEQTGNRLIITSATEGQHAEGSDHYNGEAADIAGGGLDDDNNRGIFKSICSKYGLDNYDEYENRSENWTGEHMHVSDNGEEAQGMKETAPDYDAMDKAVALYNAKVADAKREEAASKKAAQEAARNAVLAAGSQEEAEQFMQDRIAANDWDGATAAHTAITLKYPKTSGGSGAGTKAYQNKIASSQTTVDKFFGRMASGGKITSDGLISAKNAREFLIDSGALDDDIVNDLNEFMFKQDENGNTGLQLLDQDVYSHGIIGAYENVKQKFHPESDPRAGFKAALAMSYMDPSLAEKDNQGEITED